MHRILLFTLIGFITIVQGIKAQKYTYYSPDLAREKSIEHLNTLKTGSLIVRLESYENQIQHMKAMLNDRETIDDQKKKNRIERELKFYKEKREQEAKKIMEAFNENFDFCPVLYTWDKDYSIEKQHKGQLQMLNADLGYTKEPPHLSEKYYIISPGFSHPLVKPEQSGWIIMDRDHLVLQKPFPYFLEEKGFGIFHSIGVLFGVKKDHLNYGKMIQKLNERLHKQSDKL